MGSLFRRRVPEPPGEDVVEVAHDWDPTAPPADAEKKAVELYGSSTAAKQLVLARDGLGQSVVLRLRIKPLSDGKEVLSVTQGGTPLQLHLRHSSQREKARVAKGLAVFCRLRQQLFKDCPWELTRQGKLWEAKAETCFEDSPYSDISYHVSLRFDPARSALEWKVYEWMDNHR